MKVWTLKKKLCIWLHCVLVVACSSRPGTEPRPSALGAQSVNDWIYPSIYPVESNRMGKTRDFFKKIRDTKGTFHAKMGTIKDRNHMDLTEVGDIKKWQEYTEELYKKGLHNPDNHDDVITHLEPDILECEVKWALGSITTNKASGGDGIPVELFHHHPKR